MAQNQSEGIISQDGKDTTDHGAPQACIWVEHYIFHNFSTVGEKLWKNGL